MIEDIRGIKYKILSGDTGQGGSSLVYKASREDNLRIFVIKEYYSLKRYNLVRKNGILYPEDENITAEEYFEHCYDVSKILANFPPVDEKILGRVGKVSLKETETRRAVSVRSEELGVWS